MGNNTLYENTLPSLLPAYPYQLPASSLEVLFPPSCPLGLSCDPWSLTRTLCVIMGMELFIGAW